MAIHDSSLSRRPRPSDAHSSTTTDGSSLVGEQEETESSVLPIARESEASRWAHSSLGNAVLQDALSNGPDTQSALGSVLAGELTLAVGGIGGQAESLGSNEAMLRAMRDAMSLDLAGQRAVESIAGGGGTPLPSEHLERFNEAFGRDFSHVRVHADGRAAAAADALSAYAFALGAHVYFGRGQYAPGTRSGDRLLAHELTHVVQNDQGRLPSSKTGEGVQVSSPSDPHEVEAYTNETKMLDALQRVDRAMDSGAQGDAAAVDTAASEVSAPVGASEGAAVEGNVQIDADAGVAIASEVGIADAAVATPDIGAMDVASVSDVGLSDASSGATEAMLDREGGAVDKDRAKGLIQSSRGGALPDAVRGRMEAALGKDFGHVRVHTDGAAASASESLGARAFALGDDVFFGAGAYAPGSAEGDHLLAHELTHVAQYDEGRIGAGSGDLAVSSPNDAAEREARAVADAATPALSTEVAGGAELFAPAAIESTAMAVTDGVAHREAAEAGESTPEKVEVYIAGLKVEGKMPKNADPARVIVNLNWNPVPGITVRQVELQYDAEWQLERGVAVCALQVGTFIDVPELRLNIERGGIIVPEIPQVDFHIEDDFIQGKIDLRISQTGLSGTCTVGFSDIQLKDGITLDRGEVTVRVNEDLTVEAEGELHGAIEGLGEVTLGAKVAGEHMSGTAKIVFENDLQLAPGVTLKRGEMAGSFDRDEGSRLTGSATINVNDWAEASVSGSYFLPAKTEDSAQDAASGTPGGASGPAQGEQAAEGEQAQGGEQTQGGEQAPSAEQTAPGGGAPSRGTPTRPAGGSGNPSAQQDAGGAQEQTEQTDLGGGLIGGGAVASSSGQGSAEDQSAAQRATSGRDLPPPIELTLPGGGKLSAQGTLRQLADLQLGEISITNAELGAEVVDNVLQPVSFRFHYQYDKYEGDVTGTYDIAAQEASGTGSVSLTQPIELESGITIHEATGSLTIASNVATEINGGMRATVTHDGQPTFEVTGSELHYDLQADLFSGTVTATTIRPLTFGDEQALHATVEEGASATGVVQENRLVSIDGGLDFHVDDAVGEVGVGKIIASFTPDGGVNATADFTLTTTYGLPDRAVGPLFLEEGGNLHLAVTSSNPDKAQLDAVQWKMTAAGLADGEVQGTLNGEFDVKTMKASGEGDAHVSRAIVVQGEWGEVEIEEGGQAEGKVEESELVLIKGHFPYHADITAAEKNLKFHGDLDGEYTKEVGKFTGSLTGELDENVEFVLPQGQGKLVVKAGSKGRIPLEAEKIGQIGFDVDVEYYKPGSEEAFLGGRIDGGEYDSVNDKMTLDGTVTLLQDVEKESADQKWKFQALKDSQLTLSVKDNLVTRVGGNAKFKVHDTEGELLDGDLKDIDLDVEKLEFTGELDVRTARDFNFPHKAQEGEEGRMVRLNVKKGSGARGRIEKNELAEVGADLNFTVDWLEIEDALEGTLNGTWNMKDDLFGGEGSVEAKKPLPLLGGRRTDAAGKELESFVAFVVPGSSVAVVIADNELQQAAVGIDVALVQNDVHVASGRLAGDYKLGDEQGFTGAVDATVHENIDWAEGSGAWHYYIAKDTSFHGDMVASAITGATGTFILLGKGKESNLDEWRIDVGGVWAPDTGVDGSGSIHVLEDIAVGEGNGFTVVLTKGSEANAFVETSEFRSLDGNVTLRLDQNEVPKVSIETQFTYEAGEDALINAEGTITVLEDIRVQGPGDFEFEVRKDTVAQGAIKDNNLDYIEGDIEVGIFFRGEDVGLAAINGKYVHGESPDFTGRGSLEITAGYIDLGLTLPGDLTVGLLRGGGIDVEVEHNDLKTLSTAVHLMVKRSGAEFVDVTLTGTYDHQAKTVSGRAEGSLIPRVTVAEDVNGYSFYVDPSTGIWAEFTEQGIREIGGTLNVSVDDEGGQFVRATGQAVFTLGQGGEAGSLDATGHVEVVRQKELLGGQAGEWTLYLDTNTTGDVRIEANELVEVSGVLGLRVDRAEEAFATVEVSGQWRKGEGVNGRGAARLVTPRFVMAEAGNYTFTLLEGSGGDLVIENNQAKSISGTIKVGIDEGGAPFMAGEVSGDYLFDKKEFNGGGSIEVISERQLASAASGDTLWLIPGSGVRVHISKNDLDEVGGNLTLGLRDGEGEYLQCALEGSYDIKGGTGFTGEGAITVSRRKRLFGEAGSKYSFWLAEGAGAKASIKENEIEKIGGNIPFVVMDEVGDLIVGHAEGEYSADTGKFNGKGDIRLGRDVDFDVGGGLVIKFKAGSGGAGEVVDSKLEKLGGTLTAELWKDGKGVVRVSAEGEYDAVEKKLKRLEGSATLLQPIELFDGMIVISDVTGTGKIIDNKLVAAGGAGTITLPRMNNMRGSFDIKWSNETGVDKYEGKGQIDFTLFNDSAKGRSMSGMIEAEYKSDDSFHVGGKVHYQMNQQIGGEVDVAIDAKKGETLDPVIGGRFEANGTLIEGKDLFRKQLDLIPHTAVPVYGPIALFYGVYGSMGLRMNPLTFTAGIGFADWHPMQSAAKVPTFSADLALNWGMTFDAMLAAYLSIGLTAGLGSVSGGIRGEAALNVPVSVNPYGKLKGDDSGLTGELGIGVSVKGNLSLRAIPFVMAEFLGSRKTADMPNPPTINLPELFKFEWGAKYTFGDTTKKESAPVSQAQQGQGQQKNTTHSSRSQTSGGNTTAAPSQTPGGPQVGGQDAQTPDAKGAEGEGGMAQLMEKIEKIKTMAEGLGAIGYLAELISGLLTALSFGPVVLVLYVVWKIITGDLSWDKIVDAVKKVIKAVDTAMELLTPLMPTWLQNVIEVFSGKKPDLLDAFFGADDKMRAAVRKGDHRNAPGELRGKMVYEMWSGYCSDDDAWAITTMLRECPVSDCLREVGPNDLLGSFSSGPFNAAKPLVERAGYRVTTTASWW